MFHVWLVELIGRSRAHRTTATLSARDDAKPDTAVTGRSVSKPNGGTVVKKKWSVFAGIAAAALVMTGCASGSDAPAPAPSDNGETSSEVAAVTIGVVPVVDFSPVYIAQREGIFEKHGLDVTIEVVQNFTAAVPSLMNGQLQFTGAALPPFIAAVDSGVPLQAVVGTSAAVDNPADDPNQLITKPGAGIERPADMAGKTIAVNQIGSGPHVAALGEYLNDGGEPGAVEWVSMPFPEMVAAVENGTVQGAAITEPFYTNALNAGLEGQFSLYVEPGVAVMELGDPYVVLAATKQYLAENADIVERVRAAIEEATALAASDRSLVETVLIEDSGMDPDVVSALILPGFKSTPSAASFQSIIDVMSGADMVKTDLRAEDMIWQP